MCAVGSEDQEGAVGGGVAGKTEMVESFFHALAEEVRGLLAQLGAPTLEEIIGETSFLRPRNRAVSAWVEDLLRPPAKAPTTPGIARQSPGLARELTHLLHHGTVPLRGTFSITNADRSIGAQLSGEVLRKFGKAGLETTPIDLDFHGSAGPRFGAFLTRGITMPLFGGANDYVGKRLSGGPAAIRARPGAAVGGRGLSGNTRLVGPPSGEVVL